jgi:hypothetical protein
MAGLKKLNREDYRPYYYYYGLDKYWGTFVFFSRLRFEISRLRLRFKVLAG